MFFSYFLNSLQLAYIIFVIEKNGKEKTGHFGISEIDLNELENCKQMWERGRSLAWRREMRGKGAMGRDMDTEIRNRSNDNQSLSCSVLREWICLWAMTIGHMGKDRLSRVT